MSTFQDLAKRPELVSANVKCLSDNAIIINSSWHQRLIPKNEKQTIHRSHTVDRDQLRVISCSDPYLNDERYVMMAVALAPYCVSLLHLFPSATSVWKVQSPSGKWLMYMRKHALQKGKTEEHCYFEVSCTGWLISHPLSNLKAPQCHKLTCHNKLWLCVINWAV